MTARPVPPLEGATPHTESSPPPSQRLYSLDAFRGAIMLLMASSGFGLAQIAKSYPESPLWRFIGRQVEHAPWAGCTLWDIIQPAFMFMVGVALAWSIANRRARQQSFARMLGHALLRSLGLVLLGVFLTSAWSKHTEWSFNIVLAQIGLGYPFLFLIGFARPKVQWITAFAVLFGYWLAFALYPVSASPPDSVGSASTPAVTHLSGFAAHWEKNANLATAFDRWFLSLFPRDTPFESNSGGYHTLNFVPSLATMVFGLLAGQLMRSGLPLPMKLRRLTLAGIAGIVAGAAISAPGLCPIVKRIWTPSWTLYSAGWVALLLAAFVWILERDRGRGWAAPLVVAGLNPLTLYCMWQLMNGFVIETVKTHFGQHFFEILGTVWTPLSERLVVLAVFWLILWWMHRRKIYLRF